MRVLGAGVAAVLFVAATVPVPAAAGEAGAGAPDVRRDIPYGTANGKALLLDAYVPTSGEGRRPAVVMIHGGGWRAGDKASWAPEAGKLAERGWVAFSVNYRLDEPSLFPAEVDDVQTAVRWVRAHAREYGVDPDRIAALGESAGGHLTAMLAALGEGDRDTGARIRVGAAWSPPVDLTALARARGDEWANRVMGCTLGSCPQRLADASPITHVDGSDAPLYLVNSTEELVPLSQAQAMAERLRAARVEHRLDVLPGSRHALDFREEAWAPTLAFLEEHLDDRAPESGSPRVALLIGGVGVLVAAAGWLLLTRRWATETR
jgi:acetyl esterase